MFSILNVNSPKFVVENVLFLRVPAEVNLLEIRLSGGMQGRIDAFIDISLKEAWSLRGPRELVHVLYAKNWWKRNDYIFFKDSLVRRLFRWALMPEVKVVPIQVPLGVSESAHWRAIGLKCSIIMLYTLAWCLIVEAVLSKLIVMFTHYPDILDALLFALAFIWILAGLER